MKLYFGLRCWVLIGANGISKTSGIFIPGGFLKGRFMEAPTKSRSRLAFLDAARGIAVLLVLVQHGLGAGYPEFGKWTAANADVGLIGVLLFLCISGFIIPHSLEEGGGGLKFWLRRFFRLYPAYWLIIFIALIFAILDGRGMPIPARHTNVWIFNLTMFQGFFHKANVLGVFWTLHLELVIYISFWLLNYLGFLKKPGLLLGSLIALYLGLAIYFAFAKSEALVLFHYMYYAAALVGFTSQCLFLKKLTPRLGIPILIGLVGMPLLVYFNNLVYLPEDEGNLRLKNYFVNFFIAYGVFFGLVYFHTISMPRLITHLGRISYSVYLTHPLVLLALYLPGLRGWPLFVLMILGSALLSEFLFRFVEVPSITFGKSMEKRFFEKFPSTQDGAISTMVVDRPQTDGKVAA